MPKASELAASPSAWLFSAALPMFCHFVNGGGRKINGMATLNCTCTFVFSVSYIRQGMTDMGLGEDMCEAHNNGTDMPHAVDIEDDEAMTSFSSQVNNVGPIDLSPT